MNHFMKAQCRKGALWVLLVAFPLYADSYSTDFSEGLHPSFWNVTSNQSLYQIDDSQGDVRISKPKGDSQTFQYAMIGFKQQIQGDFDVTVDYRDAQIHRMDGSPGNQVQLNAHFGSLVFCVVRSDESSFSGGDNRHVWLSSPSGWYGATADTATAGTMRITRVGSVVSGYIDDVLIYGRDYSSATATISFVLQNNGTKDATSITYDNFHLTADEIVSFPGDINHDLCVNMIDFALLASEWMNTDCSLTYDCYAADQNVSGDVGFDDLIVLATHWLTCETL
jgi:hypothetical protein